MVLYTKQLLTNIANKLWGKGVGVKGINYKYENDRYKLLYIK